MNCTETERERERRERRVLITLCDSARAVGDVSRKTWLWAGQSSTHTHTRAQAPQPTPHALMPHLLTAAPFSKENSWHNLLFFLPLPTLTPSKSHDKWQLVKTWPREALSRCKQFIYFRRSCITRTLQFFGSKMARRGDLSKWWSRRQTAVVFYGDPGRVSQL